MKLEIKEYVSDENISHRIVENAIIHKNGFITVYNDDTDVVNNGIKEIINMRALTFIGLNVLDPR